MCSGQSNMWLPMHFSLSRNMTYDAMLAGQLQNIRMNTIDMNMQLDGSVEFDPYIGVPAKPCEYHPSRSASRYANWA